MKISIIIVALLGILGAVVFHSPSYFETYLVFVNEPIIKETLRTQSLFYVSEKQIWSNGLT